MTLDPKLFRPEAISEETKQFTAAAKAALAPILNAKVSSPTALRAQVLELAKAMGGGSVYHSPLAVESERKGPKGHTFHLRTFRPERSSRTAFLYVHGGGWTVGSRDGQDARLEVFAKDHGVTVVSVGYRLAPEQPFPASLDDSADAMEWFVTHARKELDVERLVVGGQSAGSNLVLASMLRLRDAGLPLPDAAALACGAYDLTMTPSTLAKGDEPGVLGTGLLAWFYDQYEPEIAKRRNPEISPLFANLRGLPPCLLVAGTDDVLLDDSLFLYSRLVAAGNQATLKLLPGGEHAVEGLPFDLGRSGEAAIVAHVLGRD